MKLQRILAALALVLTAAACTEEQGEVADLIQNADAIEFTAAWAEGKDDGSKTAIQSDGVNIWWTTGEEINVFFPSGAEGKFTSTNTKAQATATFRGTISGFVGNIEQDANASYTWAVYPYSDENSFDGSSVTLTLPSEQIATDGTFADKLFPAIARTQGLDLAFYNICGGVRFSVTQDGVTKVVFKSNDGSPMAGKVKVGFGGDNKPQILEFTEPVDSIVVNAPEGGLIPGTNYFAAMLPQAHVKGMTITLSTQDKKASRTLDNAVTVHRSLFGVLDNVDAGLEYKRSGYAVPEMVDLGLPSGLKWASFNLGATKPEEYGDYFAWGETEPKSNYSWSTYKWCKGRYTTMTKYCNNSSYGYDGFTDNKTVLDPEDDAAAVALGGSWRMPTKAEQDELITKCTWTWITQNGVNGYLLNGPNGNSIFLPAAGSRYGTSLYDAGSYGYYWSSSLRTDGPSGAYYVYFLSGYVYWVDGSRYIGQSVRPVYGEFVHPESISINKSELTLMVGCSANLSATVSPFNASSKDIIWTSSNTSIATVSSTGVITSISTGETVITATTDNGGLTTGCVVTVVPFAAKTPEAVDLGLPSGLKWASFNLGATAPEEYGGYFAWGETEPKEDYDWSTYKWCKGSSSTMTKYCNKTSYGYNGFTDNKTVLDPEDDAAAVALGGSWRMPTRAELTELRSQCTWTWTTQNGVNGRLVIGPNGNSIFLPAAGNRRGTSLYDAGSLGYYRSSSLHTDSPSSAYHVYFDSGYVYLSGNYRLGGQSVRPVSE